jgi:hypothetical protein
MRPHISYDTKTKLEKLVNELQEPSTNLGTDDQIQFLIGIVVEQEYGTWETHTYPPWERDRRERLREHERKQYQKQHRR